MVNNTLQSSSVIQRDTDAAVIGKFHRIEFDDRLDMVRERPGCLELETVVKGMGGMDKKGDDMGRELQAPGALGSVVVNYRG